MVLFATGNNAITKVFPAYLVTRGLSAPAVSSINASYQLLRGVSPPLLGRPLDRIPRHTLLAISLFAAAVLSALAALSTNVTYLILVFAAYGAAATAFYMTINSMATIAQPGRKARSLAQLEVAYQVGFFVGTAGTALLSLAFGYRSIFVLWGATAIVGGLIVVMLTRTGQDANGGVTPVGTAQVIRELRRGLGRFTLGITTAGLVDGALDIYVPVSLVRDGHRYQDAGYVFAIGAAVTGAGLLALAGPMERLGRSTGMSVSCGAMALGVLLLPASTGLAMLGGVVGLITLGRSAAIAIARAHAADTTSTGNRATGLGVYELFFGGARVAGGLITGTLLQASGRLAPLVLGTVIVACWVTVTLGRRGPA
jgi:MFS family permease